MTYKGETIIGKPSLALVEIVIAESGLLCEAQECYDYWEKKNWLTKKKVEPKTLEAAVSSYNSIATRRAIKKEQKPLDVPKASRKTKKSRKRDIPYDKQLRSKKWSSFRESAFKVLGKKCELCGKTYHLQIHHPKYKYGHLAWEYKCNEVMVVCRDCHKKIHKIT